MNLKIPEITDKKLRQTTKLLKTYAPNWVDEIVSRINCDQEWASKIKKSVTPMVVYHLSRGNVLSQFRRMIFLKHASELLIEAGNAIEEIVS